MKRTNTGRTKKDLSVGLIGLGYWGKKYLRVLSEIDNVKLSFVVDNDPSQINALPLHNAKFYSNIESALRDSSVNCCFIVTPPTAHLDIIETCFLNGVDVFIEKPVTLSLNDLNEAMSLSQKYNKLMYPGHIYAYNEGVKLVRSIVSKDDFGDILYAISSRLGLGPIREDANVVWDLMIHDLTILDLIGLREPHRVTCTGDSYVRTNIEDIASCKITYKGGISAFLQASWLSPLKIRQTIIVGENKMIIFDDTAQEFPVKVFNNKVVLAELNSWGTFKSIVRAGDIFIPALSPVEPLKQMVLSFFSSLNEENESAHTEQAMAKRVIRLLEKMTQSMKSGGKPLRVNEIEN